MAKRAPHPALRGHLPPPGKALGLDFCGGFAIMWVTENL
nr:MAG TPA: hypothetical protein [Caudoviricetes sp.]